MPNRIKAAPSLLVAAFLASLVSIATTCVAARVASDCLNGPKHQAPPRWSLVLSLCSPTNRKCWFVGEEGQSAAIVRHPKAARIRERGPAAFNDMRFGTKLLQPDLRHPTHRYGGTEGDQG